MTEWRGRRLKGAETRLKQARLLMVKAQQAFALGFQSPLDRKLACVAFFRRYREILFA